MATNPAAREACLQKGGIDLNFYREFGGQELSDPKSALCSDQTIDCKLVKNLADADAAGNNDGCVTPEDVQKIFAKFSPSQIDRIFMGYRFRADNLDADLKGLVAKEAALADSSAVTRAITWEVGTDPVRLETSRVDVFEELAYVAAFGYFVRDYEMAQGGVTTLWDIMSFPRKLAFWQDSNSMRDLFDEWGESRLSDRMRAIGKFVELLRDCISQNVGKDFVFNAVSALGDYHYKNNDAEMCNGWFGGLFFDCGDKIINEDFPVHLVDELLADKKGDAVQMAKTLYKMGVWFEENNNWLAAQYIFEQLADNGHRAGFEKIAHDSKERIHSIVGGASDSPFMDALLPPMPWNYDELSARDKFNFERDWAAFGLSWWGASLAVSGARSALGAASAIVVSKSKWLQKVIAANAKYASGASVDGAAGAAAKSSAEGVVGAAAEASVPKLGKFGQKVAQVLDATGKSLYAPFGGIKRGMGYVAAGAAITGKAVGEGMAELAASPKNYISIPAKIINGASKGAFELGKFAMVQGAKTIKLIGKGSNAFGGYLAVRAYGNPFLPYPHEGERDIGTPALRQTLGDYEMDWAIQMTLNEAERKQMPRAEMIFVVQMERAKWEGTRRAQKRCDLGLPGTPEACQFNFDVDGGPQTSAGFVHDVISKDPLLSQLHIGFFGGDVIKVNSPAGENHFDYSEEFKLEKSLGPKNGIAHANENFIVAGGFGGAGIDFGLEGFLGANKTGVTINPEDIFGVGAQDVSGGDIPEFTSYKTYTIEMADGSRYAFVVADALDAKIRAIAGEEYLTGVFNI